MGWKPHSRPKEHKQDLIDDILDLVREVDPGLNILSLEQMANKDLSRLLWVLQGLKNRENRENSK